MLRPKLIDSMRLCTRLNAPESSPVNIFNNPSMDSFVVINALRSAPSPIAALCLIEKLKKIKDFPHSKDTLYALAKILAKSGQASKLRALIAAFNSGKFVNVAYVSFLDRMKWNAGCLGRVEKSLGQAPM
ncbi:hypothetical protein ABFX02_14G261900 [Erythranthe guttata]